MHRTILLMFVILGMLTGGCDNMVKGRSAAEAQVLIFHKQFNDTNFVAIVDSAHSDLFKTSPQPDFTNFLAVARRKLGKVTDSRAANWKVQTFNGVTKVILIQETVFTDGVGTETFTFHISNAKATLLGYNITSRDMMMK